MLNRIIETSIRNRLVVVSLAALLLVYGGLTVARMPVDVFPDLNRPTVTVMTEAEGLAPEEVETLVSFPLESVLNGATGVQRVRSVSGIGLSIVYVEFDWGMDIYVARQIVAEKINTVRGRLPAGTEPVLAPISSLMGEILLLGVRSPSGMLSPMQLRSAADWSIRPRLLAVPGVSQVTVIGGEVRQYQVLVEPPRLAQYDLTLPQVIEAVEKSNLTTSGGFLEQGGQEALVRNLGRLRSLAELGDVVVAYRGGLPVYVRDVARVAFGARQKRGDASVEARPAVIMSVQKQPGANTLELTGAVLAALEQMRPSLPGDIEIVPLFQQSHFIEAAVRNVEEALRDGSLLVIAVLFCFLLNFRATFITATAIPLAFVTCGLVLKAMGASINTMTMGGLAVAIGELVDDAIVDMENVYRRLRENRQLPEPRNPYRVVFEASTEVRGSIIYATILICLVFLPLFFMGGIEGRFFQPLGVAYVVALLASLAVSLTVTPALCAYLLVPASRLAHAKDSPLVRWLKGHNERALRIALSRPTLTLGACVALFVGALSLFPFMGKEFLPPFNEGTMTLTVTAEPGTNLEESNRIGRAVERLLMEVPEVASVGRRTGRAELDEHAEGVHYSEIDVDLRPGRPKEEVLADIRRRLAPLPGVSINLGQPISHRLDHILSGVRAQIAIKIFGDDLDGLRRRAHEIRQAIAAVPGVVDLEVEKQVRIPQVRIQFDAARAARYGVKSAELQEILQAALAGRTVGEVLEGQRVYDLVVRLEEPYRNRPEVIRALLVDTPTGKVPLSALARVTEEPGPNQVLRENSRRRIVVSANVQGRDLASVIADIQRAVAALPPAPYDVSYGGQFESQQAATRALLGLSVVSVAAVFLVLYQHFRMARLALMVMAAIPMSIIGGVVGVMLTGGTLSVASMVGFVTLTGIASRNGIMRISHYIHLMENEGEQFDQHMIVRGSLERMVPVLMTALCAALALIPLALAAGVPGKEILHPVAVVILCGLLSSTLLDTVATPVMFWRFGAPVWERIQKEKTRRSNHETHPDWPDPDPDPGSYGLHPGPGPRGRGGSAAHCPSEEGLP